MLAFGLGLLSLVLINHSHLSAVPQLRHAPRGYGRGYHLRKALEFDTVSVPPTRAVKQGSLTEGHTCDQVLKRSRMSCRERLSAADRGWPAWGGRPAGYNRAASS